MQALAERDGRTLTELESGLRAPRGGRSRVWIKATPKAIWDLSDLKSLLETGEPLAG